MVTISGLVTMMSPQDYSDSVAADVSLQVLGSSIFPAIIRSGVFY